MDPQIDWQEMEWLKEEVLDTSVDKSIAALTREHGLSLFLIDGTLLGGGTPQDRRNSSHFSQQWLIQHNYLSKQTGARNAARSGFLVKDDSVKVKKEYPDYCIIAKEGQIHGGVVWKPEPRYVTPTRYGAVGAFAVALEPSATFHDRIWFRQGAATREKEEIARRSPGLNN